MQDVLDEKLTLISINISTFSGYRRATREHIAALGGQLPQSSAITEGSIKVFPCDGTKALQTVRRGLFRKVQSKGVRALGSQNVFAVLTDDLPEIEKEIAAAEADYKAELANLDSNYEQIFDDHVAANPEADAIIRSLKVSRADAVARCRFSTNIFRITPFLREGQTEEEGVEGIVRGLGRTLFEEVASEVEKLLSNDAFAKNQRVGQKTLRSLKAQTAKMTKLSFLDPSVSGAVQLVNDTLSAIPSQGYIEGQDFITLERLVSVMSDPDSLVNAASKVAKGMKSCDVLFPPAPVVVKEAEVKAPIPVGVENSNQLQQLKADASVAKRPVPLMPIAPVAGSSAQRGAPTPVATPVAVGNGVPKPVVAQPLPVMKPRAVLNPNSLLF